MLRVDVSRSFLVAAACLVLSGTADAQQFPDWLSKVSIHGYLNQAYAVSENHQIFGIPTEGTTDYRDLALQFRYDQDRRNTFLLQLRQERLGESPSETEDVELDWAFYQRHVSDRLSFKVGRVPLPLGIFNEAGGAATTSPFYKPPNEFYDRQYTSKTLEGVLGSVSLGAPAGWSFDVDAYYGQWALSRWNGGERADARDALGAQIWASTPVTGVRIGGGAYRCTVETTGGGSADYLMFHASVDADLDRWRLATEYLTGDLAYYGEYRAWYGQIGFQFSSRFSAHVRGSVSRLTVPRNGHLLNRGISEDAGVSLNYALHPALLLKLEGHTNEGLLREDVPRNLYGPSSATRYFIASIVASF